VKLHRPLFVLLLTACLALAAPAARAASRADDPLSQPALAGIGDIVAREIRAGRIPGAAVIVGHDGTVVFRHAFGNRALEPAPLPMRIDTIFDLASVTKAVATATAIMQLAERRKLSLDAPAASYWPAFAANGKGRITVRDLLTHYSGLPADLDTAQRWRGYRAGLRRILALRPVCPRETRYIYSDINFEVLGEIVRRVSARPLNIYCQKYIFRPLRMNDTFFRIPPSKRARVAPTDRTANAQAPQHVQDPTAYRMGGIAGHAGLFSTADDLAKFAQMMLDGGHFGSARILAPASIAEMTMPMSPSGEPRLRGLGWDLGPVLAANRYQLPPVGAYGHKGYTGTMLWIDPVTRTYVIVLTNRVYMNAPGDAELLRTRIIALVSEALGEVQPAEVFARLPELATWCRNNPACAASAGAAKVASGADVLESERFAPLKGLRVGLITNRTGVDSSDRNLAQLMRAAPGMKLIALFAPEHGLSGLAEGKVEPITDHQTGIPTFSLYGESRRPTNDMLSGIDALVYDLQDSGARFYTYPTTMAYAMEAAARRGIDFYVLDRPNPISAAVVQGPVMDSDLKSFTGYFPMPTRYGMTAGELAEMFNDQNRIGARLHVIAMRGYHRGEWYDQTGLPWIAPSPNLRTLAETILYPGVAMIEGSNVSVGRGTDTPFQVLGAPWIAAGALSSYLNARAIVGVHFAPVEFTPSSSTYANRACHGVTIALDDRAALDSPALGIEIIAALHRLYPRRFALDKTLSMVGSRHVLEQIASGDDPRMIVRGWQPALRKFRLLRAQYLLY
jgi:uncharacterized protein YbbC (DUF1343 family)/CubicO group peptidase (beta-lactamase class C family)